MASQSGSLADFIRDEKRLFSERNEELLIRHFFRDRRGGVFLDVGAADFSRHSTTYYLERYLGWSGIAVDALERYAEGYARNRPRTRFFSFLVTDQDLETRPFYELVNEELRSTSCPAVLKEQIRSIGPDASCRIVQRPTITLNTLLETAGVERVDFLAMDIEGGEVGALKGFDIRKYGPELVCVEAAYGAEQGAGLYFEANGYELIDDYLSYAGGNKYYKPARSGSWK